MRSPTLGKFGCRGLDISHHNFDGKVEICMVHLAGLTPGDDGIESQSEMTEQPSA